MRLGLRPGDRRAGRGDDRRDRPLAPGAPARRAERRLGVRQPGARRGQRRQPRSTGSGLRGMRIGSAWVSEKHANFVQAADGGSADDVRAVIEAVRTAVADATGLPAAQRGPPGRLRRRRSTATAGDRRDAGPTRRRRHPLPGSEVPSAEVLDELLRAFSVDVTDQQGMDRVDLGQPRGRGAADAAGRRQPGRRRRADRRAARRRPSLDLDLRSRVRRGDRRGSPTPEVEPVEADDESAPATAAPTPTEPATPRPTTPSPPTEPAPAEADGTADADERERRPTSAGADAAAAADAPDGRRSRRRRSSSTPPTTRPTPSTWPPATRC